MSDGAADTRALLRRYVEIHNLGVLTGDFSAFRSIFHPEAEIRFVGIPVGPFHGIDDTVDAFQEEPPDDDLILIEETAEGFVYGWRSEPGESAGTLAAALDGKIIRLLTITAK